MSSTAETKDTETKEIETVINGIKEIVGNDNETNENQPMSLDEDEKEGSIYIKHVESDVVHEVPFSVAKFSKKLEAAFIDNPDQTGEGFSEDNPMTVETVEEKGEFYNTPDTLAFMVKYLMYFKDKDGETPHPEAPLKSTDMSEVLGADEFKLFEDIYDKDNQSYEQVMKINSHIMTANNFDIDHLMRKECALIASFLKGKELSEVKKIMHPPEIAPDAIAIA